MPVIAGEARIYYDPPAAIPPRAVSVPMLLLGNGQEAAHRRSRIRGGRASRQRRQAHLESVERVAVRERLTRFYNDVGVQFAVVFEALERTAEPRVAAIYLRRRLPNAGVANLFLVEFRQRSRIAIHLHRAHAPLGRNRALDDPVAQHQHHVG